MEGRPDDAIQIVQRGCDEHRRDECSNGEHGVDEGNVPPLARGCAVPCGEAQRVTCSVRDPVRESRDKHRYLERATHRGEAEDGAAESRGGIATGDEKEGRGRGGAALALGGVPEGAGGRG